MELSKGQGRGGRGKRRGPPTARIVAFLGVAVAAFPVVQCVRDDEDERRRTSDVRVRLSDPSQRERGKEFAQSLCIACHIVPEPDILPKAEWRVVLSYMGFFLGQELGRGEDNRHFKEYQRSDLLSPDAQRDEIEFILEDLGNRHAFLTALGLAPETPTVSDDLWEAIRAYYEGAAPSVPLPARQEEMRGVVPFFVSKPNRYIASPNTTLVHIDERAHELYIGEMGVRKRRRPRVTVFSSDGVKKRELLLRRAPISATVTDEGLYLSLIGDFFPRPRVLRPARILFYERDGRNDPQEALTNLPRLANSAFADLNDDGLLDAVTCAHGHGLLEVGDVSWYPGTESGFGVAQPLIEYAGCVRVDLRDMDGDGRLDVLALMAGGREGLQLLVNQGGGRFIRRTILTKHPAFGFVYFEPVDFDGDGDLDVLTVNGDNQDGDIQNRVRRYHGLRIYLNDGTGELSEKFFFYLHGAVMARARDFDGDGDLEVAAISSYPRSGKDGPVSFVYLQNEGDLRFTPWTHEANVSGRWMVMDAGDLDGDDDIDIVLGGFAEPVGLVGEVLEKTLEEGSPTFLILENTHAGR